MDPLSLSASLVTLGAAVAASFKLIYNLKAKLGRDVPKDVEALLGQMKNFGSLLQVLTDQHQKQQNSSPSQDTVPKLWENTMTLMLQDINDISATFRTLESSLDKNSPTSKISPRIRKWLSEKQIIEYQRKMSENWNFLANVQMAVFRSVIHRSLSSHEANAYRSSPQAQARCSPTEHIVIS